MTRHTERRYLLNDLLCDCEDEARQQGWIGDWEPQPADLAWIADSYEEQVGRKPTSQEWADVHERQDDERYAHVGKRC